LVLPLSFSPPTHESRPHLRASQPTLLAASKTIAAQREAMLAQWSEWLGDRLVPAKTLDRALVERQLGLILDVLATLIGPLRREAKPIWVQVSGHYGRIAAARGLAAGEVVEEMQYLRELLIRYLAPAIAAFRPRQGMALLLRLNRLVDQGVAMAVVGYTDALVTSILPDRQGDAQDKSDGVDEETVRAELDELAEKLLTVSAHHANTG
jgi:hypothetical protein